MAGALTVHAQDPVRVLWPDGNEVYAWGDTIRIRWDAVPAISLVGVALSVDAGNTWCELYAGGISRASPGWGDTTWSVTPTIACQSGSVALRSASCLVRVSNYIGSEFDRSGGLFTIDSTPAPSLRVLSPNGGETYCLGDTLRIRWQAYSGVPMARVILSADGGDRWCDLYPGGGISRGSVNWGDTMWVVTQYLGCALDSVNTLSTACLVRVANYVGTEEDRSDAQFTIADSVQVEPPPEAVDEPSDCGCGSGTEAALIPPFVFWVGRRVRRHRKHS